MPLKRRFPTNGKVKFKYQANNVSNKHSYLHTPGNRELGHDIHAKTQRPEARGLGSQHGSSTAISPVFWRLYRRAWTGIMLALNLGATFFCMS